MPKEVVERDRLVELIDDFLRSFKETEESEVEIPKAAVECLAIRTGKNPDTVDHAIRRIKKEKISNFVSLGTADWLVAVGMGRPDLFHTDLEVIVQGSKEEERENHHTS